MVADTFTRTGPGPGVADTGEAWRTESGTWSTNGAELVQTGPREDNLMVTIACTGARRDVSTRILGAPRSAAFPGLVLAFVDVTNYSWAEIGPTGDLRLYRSIAGERTTLATTSAGQYPAGALLTVRVEHGVSATDYTLFVDGVSKATASDTASGRPTGSRSGLRYGIGSTFTSSYSYAEFTSTDLDPETPYPGGGRQLVTRVGGAWVPLTRGR